MNLKYTIDILQQDYSQIRLISFTPFIYSSLLLTLDDISPETRQFYHDDVCTYDNETKKIKVIESPIIHQFIIGDIKIDKKIIYGMNQKRNPYYLFTPTNMHYPKCLVAINNKISKPQHQSRYIAIIKYRNKTNHIQSIETPIMKSMQNSSYPIGELIKIIGPNDDEMAQYNKVLYEHNIIQYKSKKISMHSNFKSNIPYTISIFNLLNEGDILKKYKIMYHLNVITIDPPHSLDIDDGLSYEFIFNKENSYGIHRIGIHITDVSFWVSYFDLFDYLNQRQFTLYTKIENFNIFPKIFSQHLFSLKTNQERLAISLFVDFQFDPNTGKYIMMKHKFQQSIIKVRKNLTYTRANTFIDQYTNQFRNKYTNHEQNEHEQQQQHHHEQQQHHNEQQQHHKHYHEKSITKRNRSNKKLIRDLGMLFMISIDILPDCNIEMFDSKEMVQKYMILCNKLVAEHLITVHKPILRTHNDLCTSLTDDQKLKISQINDPKVRKFIQCYFAEPGIYKQFNESISNPSIPTTSSNYYHCGLNLPYYTHFTSPIRRSVDIHNQFILKNDPIPSKYPEKFMDVNKINNACKENKLIQRKLTMISIKKYLQTKINKHELYIGYIINLTSSSMYIYFPNLDFIHHHKFNRRLLSMISINDDNDTIIIPTLNNDLIQLCRFESIHGTLTVINDSICFSF